MQKTFLTAAEAADYLGGSRPFSIGTLAKWRARGFGPRYVKAGVSIRYRLADLDAWLDARTHGAPDVAA